jgi:PAS domain S-box-containing protein
MAVKGDDLVQVTLLGEALEHLPLAVFVSQESGARVAVNLEACRLTGYAREELLALPAEELSGRSARDHKRKLEDFARRQRAPGRGPLRRKDGSVIEVDYRWNATRVAGMDFYLFVVAPTGTSPFLSGKRKRG